MIRIFASVISRFSKLRVINQPLFILFYILKHVMGSDEHEQDHPIIPQAKQSEKKKKMKPVPEIFEILNPDYNVQLERSILKGLGLRGYWRERH